MSLAAPVNVICCGEADHVKCLFAPKTAATKAAASRSHLPRASLLVKPFVPVLKDGMETTARPLPARRAATAMGCALTVPALASRDTKAWLVSNKCIQLHVSVATDARNTALANVTAPLTWKDRPSAENVSLAALSAASTSARPVTSCPLASEIATPHSAS